MISASLGHTLMLRSDGKAFAFGCNLDGQCDVPALEKGLMYTQVAAGGLGWRCHKNPHKWIKGFSVLLQSDGKVVAFGSNTYHQCDMPSLSKGLTFTQVSAGDKHTVLLQSDGNAVACGCDESGACSVPGLKEGLRYSQVSAGQEHTLLLQNGGVAVACGDNRFGQSCIPALNEGVKYVQVSAGAFHSVLLQSDGNAVACGCNTDKACNIPALDILSNGVTYVQVSAGQDHTLLLQSNGVVVACGDNRKGQCDIPDLPIGESYVQVSAGSCYSVLLRSDGVAVACGSNDDGQTSIPDTRTWLEWSCSPAKLLGSLVLELALEPILQHIGDSKDAEKVDLVQACGNNDGVQAGISHPHPWLESLKGSLPCLTAERAKQVDLLKGKASACSTALPSPYANSYGTPASLALSPLLSSTNTPTSSPRLECREIVFNLEVLEGKAS